MFEKIIWRKQCFINDKKKKTKSTTLLSKILIHLFMIIHYIVEENILVVIVYKLLVQQKYWQVMLMIVWKLIVNKWLRCQKTANMLDSKIMKKRNEISIYELSRFWKYFNTRK